MPNVPFRRQILGNDCGPACLQMLGSYYGRELPLDSVISLCDLETHGASMLSLANAAEKLGFRSLVARVALQDLKRIQMPCIAHCGHHFVVIESITKRHVKVADPKAGKLRYTLEQFSTEWADSVSGQGVVLILEPVQMAGRASSGKLSDLAAYCGYLRGFAWQLTQLLLGIGLTSVFQVLLAALTRSLVDIAIPSASTQILVIILVSQLVLFSARGINEYLRSAMLVHLTARLNLSVLADFLHTILRADYSYIEQKTVGDILQRVGDHGRVQSFLTSSLISTVAALANLVVFCVALALVSPAVTAIFIVTSAALAVWITFFRRRLRELDNQRFELGSSTQTTLFQMIAGMRDIRLATRERAKRLEWERLQGRQFRLSLTSLRWRQRLQAGGMAISQLRTLLITFVTASAVIHGSMTLGTMMAIAFLVGSASGPIDQIVSLIQSAQEAKLSVDRIAEVHQAATVTGDPSVVMPAGRDIALKGVSFRYRGSASWALHNLSLQVPHGMKLAIVGASGSGKSTLVKLLVRLYDPQIGTISIGGAPLTTINVSEWRRSCKVALQDSFIFSDTFAANVAFGADEIDYDRLQHVCHVTLLTDVVRNLPDGVHTRIGPQGHELSSGERQRVQIARAIYGGPDVVVLDEATGMLDGRTERDVLSRVYRELSDKTVIVVAHRLSTVMASDSIIVLRQGEIVECGTHPDLVASGQTYYSLIRSQLQASH